VEEAVGLDDEEAVGLDGGFSGLKGPVKKDEIFACVEGLFWALLAAAAAA